MNLFRISIFGFRILYCYNEVVMRFSQLCADAGLGGTIQRGDTDVRSVVTDSRRVGEGDCFVAVPGPNTDGHRYIASAVAARCAAVVCEDASDVPAGIALAVVDDSRLVAGPLAQASLGWPCRKLTVAGVTGTNGKTTIIYLLRHILDLAGMKVGMLGTVSYETIAHRAPARTTTPGAVELAEMMDEIVAAGGTHLVMEVSSHALDQRRTEGIDFDVAVLTNISGDHLDYHGSMENYLAAKRRLFETLGPDAWTVLNRDEDCSEQMAASTSAKVIWYGLSGASDVSGRIDNIDITGSSFLLRSGSGERDIHTTLIGRHNVYNCLAAAAAAEAMGVDMDTVAEALGQVCLIPGRLQRIETGAPFEVLVDYAHTDDALDKVLSALRPVTAGKLIVVFGCGGDRDRSKRPRMANAAERWADTVIVTSDNPRNEEPTAIIEEIMTGFSTSGREKVITQPDRRSAIAEAIDIARANDVVLIAGKGHENYQVIGDERIHFDDVEIVEQMVIRNS